MNRKIVACACAGIAGIVLMVLGEGSLGWNMLTPLSPQLSAAQVAAHFRAHHAGMLMAGVFHVFGLCFYFVFTGGLTACFRKMEGPVSPLTNAYLMMTPFCFFTVLFTTVVFAAAAFRPDLPDTTVRLLSDLGLLMFTFTAANGFVLFGLAGLIIMGDRNPQPIFPRWIGYLALVVAVLSAPAALAVVYKTGPFAWNGLLGFHIPTLTFGVLIICFLIGMFRAAKHPALLESELRHS
jgi:hypothetical protein